MKFCLIRDELIRRNEMELEEHRQYGAALIAAMVRDWWASISNATDSLVLLADQHHWRAALRQNRLLLTQLTDVSANWMSKAITRSPHALSYPPGVSDDPPDFTKEGEMATVVDEDWLFPRSPSASSFGESAESSPDSGGQFDSEDFSWGLQSAAILPPQSADNSSCSEDISENDYDDDVDDYIASVSSDASVESTITQEDVAGLVTDASLPLNEVMEPYLTNGWQPQPLLADTHTEEVSSEEMVCNKTFILFLVLLVLF